MKAERAGLAVDLTTVRKTDVVVRIAHGDTTLLLPLELARWLQSAALPTVLPALTLRLPGQPAGRPAVPDPEPAAQPQLPGADGPAPVADSAKKA